jgi:hypothetical protein
MLNNLIIISHNSIGLMMIYQAFPYGHAAPTLYVNKTHRLLRTLDAKRKTIAATHKLFMPTCRAAP